MTVRRLVCVAVLDTRSWFAVMNSWSSVQTRWGKATLINKVTCFVGHSGERVWVSRYGGANHGSLSISGINVNGIDIDKGSNIILDGGMQFFTWNSHQGGDCWDWLEFPMMVVEIPMNVVKILSLTLRGLRTIHAPCYYHNVSWVFIVDVYIRECTCMWCVIVESRSKW